MSKTQYSNIKISGISFVIPDNKQASNNPDCEFFYTSPEGVTNVDMCEAAAKDLINNMNIDINTLDAVIFVNQYPDHLSPSSSHIIHKRLNLPTTCFVFDIYHGGAGFVYGLWVAGSLLNNGKYKKIMLLAGDYINERNTNFSLNLCLSSSGAALLLEYSEDINSSFFVLGGDSSKYDDIIIPAGSYRIPASHATLNDIIEDSSGNKWTLNQKIFDIKSFENFIYSNIPEAFAGLLQYSNLKVDDIDFFAINQFSKDVVDNIAGKLNIPALKYSTATFKKYGNQTIISSLANIIDVQGDRLTTLNNRLCFITYGEGLSYALAVINIDNIYCSGIKIINLCSSIMAEDYHKYWIGKIQSGQ